MRYLDREGEFILEEKHTTYDDDFDADVLLDDGEVSPMEAAFMRGHNTL